MVIIWVIRFMQDEDLCLVEYKTFRDARDIELPDTSLCFEEPFDERKLNSLGTTSYAYREHLAGNSINASLANVNYEDVIFKLGETLVVKISEFRIGHNFG